MITRHDFRSAPTEVPQALQETLLRVGGKNIHKEAMYRLCLAQDRTRRCAGAWAQWKPGTSLDERSGLGIKELQRMLRNYKILIEVAIDAMPRHDFDVFQKQLNDRLDEHIKALAVPKAPNSVERGMMDIPIYNFEGWILEKWKPAHTFGSQDEWYAFRFEGKAALGPYPIHGEYELCAGPTPYQPSSEQLETAIHEEIRKAEARPTSARERMVQTMLDIERQQEAQDRETQNQVEAAYKDASVLMNRLSLGAGKVRTELALKAGITEHYGN
jgi:hypothetical protein